MDYRQFQERVGRVILSEIGAFGFALAGSGAIREHGMIDRPTDDLDIFTIMKYREEFPRAVSAAAKRLEDTGYTVEVEKRGDMFARLTLKAPDSDAEMTVDMGIDWRGQDTVTMDIGPVTAADDAVTGKVSALYGRSEPRDYLDVDAILQSGRYTGEQLISLLAEADQGFNLPYFVRVLGKVGDLRDTDVEQYGYAPRQLSGVKRRLSGWAEDLSKGIGIPQLAAEQIDQLFTEPAQPVSPRVPRPKSPRR